MPVSQLAVNQQQIPTQMCPQPRRLLQNMESQHYGRKNIEQLTLETEHKGYNVWLWKPKSTQVTATNTHNSTKLSHWSLIVKGAKNAMLMCRYLFGPNSKELSHNDL